MTNYDNIPNCPEGCNCDKDVFESPQMIRYGLKMIEEAMAVNNAKSVFLHDVPTNEYSPELYPVEHATRILWDAGLLPDPTGKTAKITIDSEDPEVIANVSKAVEDILNEEISIPDFSMYDDQLARSRREAVRFAIMEEVEGTSKDIPHPDDMDEWASMMFDEEFPDIEIPDSEEPMTEEEVEAWRDHCDWFNNIFEYDLNRNNKDTKEEDDLYKNDPDLDN